MIVFLVALLILAIIAIVTLSLSWMDEKDAATRARNEKNMLEIRYKNIWKKYEELKESLSTVRDNSRMDNRAIAKIIEIMVGLTTETAEDINYYYVGDLPTEVKFEVKQYFEQFSDEKTDANSMWWSRYDKNGILDGPERHIQEDNAAFICFKR